MPDRESPFVWAAGADVEPEHENGIGTRNLLVVAQVAMALVLLVGSGVDDSHLPGVARRSSRGSPNPRAPDDANLDSRPRSSRNRNESHDCRTAIVDKLAAIPGVTSVGSGA